MSSQSDSERAGSTKRNDYLESVVNALALLAGDKVYGILDTMVYVSDNLSLVYSALYSGIRYLEARDLEANAPTEEDLRKLFAIANNDPRILKEVAIRALARALRESSSSGSSEGGHKGGS